MFACPKGKHHWVDTMNETNDDIGELERDQQMLKDKIAESDRLIEETDQMLEESRAYTGRSCTD